MQSIQDKMMLSGSDESDRDEEDAEWKATQGKETDTVVVEEDDVATEGAARKRPKAAAPKKSALKAEASRMNQELMKQVPLLATPGLDKDSCTDASFKATVLEKATCSYSETSIGLYNSRSPVASASSSLYNSRSPVASIPPNSSQAITSPEAKPTTVVEEDKGGCWLGNPHSHVQEMKKVWIPKGETNKVSMAEAISTDPARLAVNLLTVFFCKEEPGSGNCTPAPGRQLLNPAIIQGIRLHVNYKYPADSDEEKARWKILLHINLNSKCRNARASLLSASDPPD
eukprot:Em0016g691a